MMRRTWLGLCAALAIAVFATYANGAEDARPGDDFLKLVDAKKYSESYDLLSSLLKTSVSRSEWTAQLVRARDTIGDVASRTLKESKAELDPGGAPPGEYLIQTYTTVFASQGAPKTETLPLVKDADGHWRAVGYFVR